MWDDEPDLEALRRLHGMLATDTASALAGLKELAGRGSSMSMLYVANAYRQGKGVDLDVQQAEEWYRRAAVAGVVPASYELGRIYLDAKDFVRAHEEFSVGAAQHYSPSMNALAIMYKRGSGVPVDLKKARDLLEGAAAQGHIFAKRNLAYLLMNGGLWHRLRAFFLLVSASLTVPVVVFRDPESDRLR